MTTSPGLDEPEVNSREEKPVSMGLGVIATHSLRTSKVYLSCTPKGTAFRPSRENGEGSVAGVHWARFVIHPPGAVLPLPSRPVR